MSAQDAGNSRPIQESNSIAADQAAERELQYERYLLRSLLDNIPDSVYFKDDQSRFIRVSSGLADKFGLENPQEAIGKTDFDFFTEEHAQQARADELDVMRTGNPILGKTEKETWQDGNVTWSSTTKIPLRDRQGEIIGTLGVTRDISDLHEAETALGRERDRLLTLMDALPDLIYVKDPDGKFLLANRALTEFFGVASAQSIYQRTTQGFFPDDLAELFRQEDLDVVTTGTPIINRETRVTGPDDQELWLLTTKVPLRDSDGQVVGVVGIDRNITKRKQAEEQLRTAKEAADAASRAKSDFLANMSHEIRTPMNAILGMAELLLDSHPDAAQREYLEVIASSGQALLSLINDILDLSKIEAGKLDLDELPFDIRESLGDAMKSLAVRAHAKGLEVAFRVAPDIPIRLQGDAARLRQVLINLVGNAIKFTESGEIVVEVETGERNDNQISLAFSIVDTGIGIPRDKFDSIFQKFQQADMSTTRQFGGTGLGLAISSRIIESMGGNIEVDSDLGKGSTFRFRAWFDLLPESSEKEPPFLQVLKVLVVDHHATSRRILSEILGSCQADVATVSNIHEALIELKRDLEDEHPWQLVLIDVDMPGVDGWTLVDQIRQDSELKHLPVIALTSGSRMADRNRESHQGREVCLLKPVKQADLIEAVMRQVNQTSMTSESIPSQSTSSVQPLRVLLAEDNVVNQKLATALLRQMGHEVTLVTNGQEAVDARKSEAFDIVFMDIQMPQIDGLEACRQIRAWELDADLPRIPIVALTAHAMKSDRLGCLEVGMDCYLAKPVRRDELRQTLEQFATAHPRESRQAPAEQTSYLIDWPAALASAGGNKILLAEVIDAVIQEIPRFQREIATGIETTDLELLERAAHSLKGSLAFLGAESILIHARELEAIANQGELGEAPQKAAQLDSQLEPLLKECHAFRSGTLKWT